MLGCPVLAALALVLAQFNLELPWALDLGTHWVLPAGVGLLGLSLFGSRLERVASLAGAAACLVLAIAAEPNAPPASPGSKQLKMVLSNVLSTNANPDLFLQWLAQEKPEIVGVLEVDAAWADKLSGLPEYPYQRVFPRFDNFGIALLSKHPLELAPEFEGVDLVPSITALVNVPEGPPLRVVLLHPVTPSKPEGHFARNEQLRRLGASFGGYSGPSVMLGDFNASPWSSPMRILENRGLQRVTGSDPTWPTLGVFPGVLPLDQVLVNRQVLGASAEVGPNVGSDHRPVLVRLQLR